MNKDVEVKILDKNSDGRNTIETNSTNINNTGVITRPDIHIKRCPYLDRSGKGNWFDETDLYSINIYTEFYAKLCEIPKNAVLEMECIRYIDGLNYVEFILDKTQLPIDIINWILQADLLLRFVIQFEHEELYDVCTLTRDGDYFNKIEAVYDFEDIILIKIGFPFFM